jgi:hypothetical protein
MMAASGPSRWGGWLGDQGGQGTSFRTELYTVPSLAMCVPPNPQRSAQKQQACLLLDLLLACRNVLGFREDFLPAMRFDALVRYAASFAASARETERDLLSFRQAYEQESFSLLQATNQLALNESEIGLEQLNVEMALGDERLAELQLMQGTHAAEHYETLLAEGLTTMEQLALTAAWGAAAFSGLAAAGGLLSAAAGAVGTATSISGNPVSIATGVVGIAGTLLGGAGQLAGFASSVSSAASMQAGFERREQEWQFTHEQGLATQASAEVNAQQAALRTTYARRRLDLAGLRRDLATDAVQFLNAKFLNAAMYAWMVRTVREQYKRRLGYAITASYMAERALAFELQNPALRLIRFDYFDPRRDGLLGATQLQTDLSALESLRLAHTQRRLQLSKTLSLAAEMPAAFAAFRRSGRIVFGLPSESFDRDFPGHYLRQIKSVRVTVVALIPPREGIRATLSNSGVSTVVVGPPYAPGFESRQLLRRPESLALSAPHQATGLFVLNYDDPLLLPFEGSGVETGWQFDLPRAANAFDFDTIADVQMTIEYTALESNQLRSSVIARLDRRRLLDRAFSLRQHFPDEWYRLHHPDQVAPAERMVATLRTRRQDFAPNLTGLEIVHVGILFLRREGSAEVAIRHLTFTETGATTLIVGDADPPAQVITSSEGVISTRAGNAPTTWDSLLGSGHSPAGTWELAIADDDATIARLVDGEVEDILFAITYAGQSPPWPT